MPVVSPPRRVHVEHVMGTVASFDLRGGSDDGLEAALRSLRDADARFSTYRADSEIRRLDRGALRLADASDDVRAILARCERLREVTGGYFDARAGGKLDPSALVKGWAVQRAADLLVAGGATDFCLSAGGDVVTRGSALPRAGWTIGIQHPHDPAAVAARVSAGSLSIATSGAYERGAHIVDPHTRRPARDVLSVTIVGPDLGTADAYSTAAFAMGARGPAWTRGLDGYEALTILADDTVLSTPGFPWEDA
jgi:thiamine biosynthesis lipoprotein